MSQTDPLTTSVSTTGEPERPTVDHDLKSMTHRMAKWLEHLGTGELAELRRITPDAPFTPTLWRLLLSSGFDQSPAYMSQETWERRWATVLMALAFNKGLHKPSIPLGRALAQAGWSELRFVKLMRSRGEPLEIQIRLLARFLSSRSEPADWSQIAELLFQQQEPFSDRVRIRIARDYYRSLKND